LRIQRRQSEVARFARELFELKAEIMATKFDWPLLTKMTGIELPSQEQKQTVQALMQQVQQAQQAGQEIPPQIAAQAEQAQKIVSSPTQEEVMQLLQDDISRNYRIDIESDSTIRNDLTRNQQTMNLFLQGTAQFGQAMGPIIMADAAMKPVVMEIYGAFARQFKLGRQAEDAIEAATEQAQKTKDQPPPEDPKIQAEKMKAEIAKQKADMDAQAQQQKMQFEQQKAQMDLQAAQQKHEMELQKMQAELQMQREEMQIMREKMGMEMQAAQQKATVDAQAMEHKAALNERTAELQSEGLEHKHTLGMEAAEHKAKMAKQAKPKNGARA
jgi:hypothetical protein